MPRRADEASFELKFDLPVSFVDGSLMLAQPGKPGRFRCSQVSRCSDQSDPTRLTEDIDWIGELAVTLREFRRDPEWEKFHSPRNLAAALSFEAAELLEVFQWLTDERSFDISQDSTEPVAAELADVLIYLVRVTDVLCIDLRRAVQAKLAENADRYPVAESRGRAEKAPRSM